MPFNMAMGWPTWSSGRRICTGIHCLERWFALYRSATVKYAKIHRSSTESRPARKLRQPLVSMVMLSRKIRRLTLSSTIWAAGTQTNLWTSRLASFYQFFYKIIKLGGAHKRRVEREESSTQGQLYTTLPAAHSQVRSSSQESGAISSSGPWGWTRC